jgi:hypothetical protein
LPSRKLGSSVPYRPLVFPTFAAYQAARGRAWNDPETLRAIDQLWGEEQSWRRNGWSWSEREERWLSNVTSGQAAPMGR